MYYAVWATDRTGALTDRERVREAHRVRLRNPGEHKVKVLLGGPTLDERAVAMNGSLLVVEADDIEAVRRFIAEDPFQLAKVYATVEVRPWNWGLGRPGGGA